MYDWRRSLVSWVLVFLALSAVHAVAAEPVLICFGDSITAGYGVHPGESYPDALGKKLAAAGYHYRVMNRGTSGATTKDAVKDVAAIVREHPQIVVVEFGGNDGLRGLPLAQMERNLEQVVEALKTAQINVLLTGITLPPNYGADYIAQFEGVYRRVAEKEHVALLPMIYSGLRGKYDVLQADGIHPTARGAEIVASTVLSGLKPMLGKGGR